MPVLPVLPQAIKIGGNFVPQDALGTGVLQATAQATLTIPALMITPAGVPIPLPVIGIVISILMTKLKVLPAEINQKMVKIIADLQKQYNKQYEDAQKKRSDAQTKLYTDLTTKQKEIKEEIKTIEDNIKKLKKEIEDLTIIKDAEMAKYQAVIFEYAAKAKDAEEQGKEEEKETYIQKIKELDYWLAEIVTMLTTIINKKLELKFMEMDLSAKKELAAIAITSEWEPNVELATDFEVAVPYYPDLPDQPQLPVLPRFPKIPDQLRTFEQQFNKWLVCPVVPPLGIAIAALLLMLKEKVPNNPITAAQIDSQAEMMIPLLGGMV
jgi:hypothetical protein